MGPQPSTVEARIAQTQHGVVTRAQLLRAGLSAKQVRGRVERGALIPVHRGIYRVGHAAPSVHAAYLAAVLACGDGALLCGVAAAFLMGLLRRRSVPPAPEVLARTARMVPGVRAHRGRPERGWIFDGIPCTTVPRTLVDLAARLSLDDLAVACHEAGVRYRTTPRQVKAVLAPNAPGARNLRLVAEGDSPAILSQLERGFRRCLREARLPLPDETNRVAGGHRVDCRWLRPPLTVELDSYRFHNSRRSWETGHRREREAYARGDAFRRYTWTDVFEDPTGMLAELAEILACSGQLAR